MTKSQKTCEICNTPHNNRKVDRCNDCREDICKRCNNVRNMKYSECYFCRRFFDLDQTLIPKLKKIHI